jgi:ribosomal protein S30
MVSQTWHRAREMVIDMKNPSSCLRITCDKCQATQRKNDVPKIRHIKEFRNQHLGFAASTTSTLPHFKIKHFF